MQGWCQKKEEMLSLVGDAIPKEGGDAIPNLSRRYYPTVGGLCALRPTPTPTPTLTPTLTPTPTPTPTPTRACVRLAQVFRQGQEHAVLTPCCAHSTTYRVPTPYGVCTEHV